MIQSQPAKISYALTPTIYESLTYSTPAHADDAAVFQGYNSLLFDHSRQSRADKIVWLPLKREAHLTRHGIVAQQTADCPVVLFVRQGKANSGRYTGTQLAVNSCPCHDSSPKG